ncbi:MAG: response regulator, partial [Dongiaceae bacterium]
MSGDLSEKIVENLKYLRRYARALLGSQQSGDMYVRLCLETLLQQRDLISDDDNLKLKLFKLFHEVYQRVGVTDATEPVPPRTEAADLSVGSRLGAIPPSAREVLLLTALEGFALKDVAVVLDVSLDDASRLLDEAWSLVKAQVSTTVLIIEDEPVIALDISGLASEMGHTVVGIAADQMEAVKIAKERQPGLVLGDIDLGAGGSGLVAIQEILQSLDMPVIFITAYPERLLTG